MHESIKQLLTLQERDLELDRVQTSLAQVPGEILTLKGRIEEAKTQLENSKKELTQLQLSRKEKEVDLESKENAIRKHAGELNAVKTNEAYRALMGEIDKIKQEKSVLEDGVLQLMEQIDQANRTWKQKEMESKTVQADLQKQISDLEAKQKALEAEAAQKRAEREQAVTAYSKGFIEQYERIRQNKKGAAIVPLKNEQCSGCHMKVSQNLINELRRGQKVLTCESCARIVYLQEVPAA